MSTFYFLFFYQFANILKGEDVRAKTSNDYFKSATYSNVYENLESSLVIILYHTFIDLLLYK